MSLFDSSQSLKWDLNFIIILSLDSYLFISGKRRHLKIVLDLDLLPIQSMEENSLQMLMLSIMLPRYVTYLNVLMDCLEGYTNNISF